MYQRILIKISGEALAGKQGTGLDPVMISQFVEEIKLIYKKNIQIGLVIGGGNFWRGRTALSMDSVKADQMGMLATVMNSICVQDALIQSGMDALVLTAHNMLPFAEQYTKEKALNALGENKIVIFAGGTGNPFFSTDTGAVLRSLEIGAEIVLFAKNIDGVYDSDPRTNPNAEKFNKITFREVLDRNLQVMDLTAATLCMGNNLPLLVFGLNEKGNILKAVSGEQIGTLVHI